MTETTDRADWASPPSSAPGDEHDDPTIIGADATPPEEASSWSRLAILVGALTLVTLLFGFSVLGVIVAIVVSIFLHEMGHFLAARRTGMKASEFFIGFGPRIWSFRRGETEYGLKAIPAGAYVKVLGMSNLDEVDPAEEARTYRQASYPRRVLLAFAGPGMNLLLAFLILFGVAFVWGLPNGSAWPRVSPADGGAADLGGIEEGDRIVSFDGIPAPADFNADEEGDFSSLIQSRAGETVDVVVERDGAEETLSVDVGTVVAGMVGLEWPTVSGVLSDSPASAAALQRDDVIVGVDGGPVPDQYEDFVDVVLSEAGGQVALTVERDGEEYATALAVPDDVEEAGFLGISPYFDEGAPNRNPVLAAADSGKRTGEFLWVSVYGLGRFFSPQGLSGFADQVVSTPPVETSASTDAEVAGSDLPPLPDEPGLLEAEGERVHSILGIITIGSQLGSVAEILVLVALLNIFLAMFNLIPLLPFDGGHIAVATYERVREGLARRHLLGARLVGSRYFADFAKLIPVTYVVVALIVSVGIGALYLDAVDPVDLGN